MSKKTAFDFSRRRRPRESGAALILMLGMLVLLTGVVLAFLVTVRTESGASKAYEGGANARGLADSAVNLVIGQIREASTQPRLAWISQPGLMRTFEVGGAAVKSYKLYSAESLVEEGSFDPTKGVDLPASSGANSWQNQPGLWTDLNAPVADLSRVDPFDPGKTKKLMVYPIFDGNHINSAGQMSLNKDGNADIEGFTVEQFATRAVSMPVRWIYLLKDGTLASAKASGTGGDVEVLVPVGKEKTAQGEVNRPVARMAFWTDDETAKVNVNTASEGTFWDTPVGNSQPGVNRPWESYLSNNEAMFEWDLAERIGAQKEFQRYAGHPATTCLSAIFGRQLLLVTGGDRWKMIEEINKMIPRVTGTEYLDLNYSEFDRDYSSKGGMKRAGPEQGQFKQGQSSGDLKAYPVRPDGERLYATIDEFLYSPMVGSAGTPRVPWTLAPRLSSASGRDTTREMLEMSKFFLTANSKAPEQYLFNQPRVAIWPVQVSETRRTAFDKLVAFCATMGPKGGGDSLPFYFTRENANDGKADLSARNLAVMGYLKGLTGRAVPGWDAGSAPAKSFAAKYSGGDRDQILTEIFDYIRCTNLADTSDDAVKSAYTQTEENPVNTGVYPMNESMGIGHRGQVVPIEMPDGTRGMGRIVTISELALVMIRKDNTAKIEFSFLPKLFCPMAGFSAVSMGLRLTFKKIDFKVTDMVGAVKYPFLVNPENGSSGLAAQPTLYDSGRVGEIEDKDLKIGGTIGLHMLCESGFNQNPGPYNRGSPVASVPPTAELVVSNPGNSGSNFLTFEGSVTVEISAPARETPTNSTNEPVVQTITFVFPKQQVPLPTSGGEMAVGGTGGAVRGNRINSSHEVGIDGNDTIRSVVAVGNQVQGDMRLVAARKVVDGSYFKPANNGAYADSARRTNQTHSLCAGWHDNVVPGADFGYLVKGITSFDAVSRPDIPAGINGVMNALGQPGDWDNGPAFVPDGAFCNKPDEGAQRHRHGGVNGVPFAEDSAPYIGYFYQPEDALHGQNTFFAPNRQIPSAVMLGSLPTGVMQNKPWQTLLFRPAKSYLPGGVNHPGSAVWGPPDHLLLDLFWMPVVEPYAISEPFATSGKINLNQQIVPFTNIRRDTGLRAVMKEVKVTAINPNQPDSAGLPYSQRYKLCGTPGLSIDDGPGGGHGVVLRRGIDLDNTLKQVADRQAKNKPFISASEICDLPLIPKDLPVVATMRPHVSAGFSAGTDLGSFETKLGSFWGAHQMTGDNSLEKPYAHIYPRLTTRSNSYTVHVRVQVLPQRARESSWIIKATQSQPTGEFRGSFLIERYLDANTAGFVDSAGNPASVPASGETSGLALGPYRFRTVSSKQFLP